MLANPQKKKKSRLQGGGGLAKKPAAKGAAWSQPIPVGGESDSESDGEGYVLALGRTSPPTPVSTPSGPGTALHYTHVSCRVATPTSSHKMVRVLYPTRDGAA